MSKSTEDSIPDALATLGAGALVIHRGQALLVQLNYGRAKGAWILPGGMVNQGEHPDQAAVREVKEETNLDIDITGQLAVRSRLNKDGNLNIYWAFFGELKNEASFTEIKHQEEELMDARFWDIEEALNCPDIRPLTKVYIRMGLEHDKAHPHIPKPKDQEMDDIIYGISYGVDKL